MPESQVYEQQALQSNRMITVKEQNLRKSIAVALFAMTSAIVWARVNSKITSRRCMAQHVNVTGLHVVCRA